MCVDGSCGTFTTPQEENENERKVHAALDELKDNIAGQLPQGMPSSLREGLAAIIALGIAQEAIDEVRAKRAARDNREMVGGDLGMVA